MRALITGIGGFVGAYLKSELQANGYDVAGCDVKASEGVYAVDLRDAAAARECIGSIRPDVIFHLAGQSSAALSWSDPKLTFDINLYGTLNLMEAVRAADNGIKLMVTGSSDEYGRVPERDCPISETRLPDPVNPYAVSKTAASDMALIYAKAYNMDIIVTRSFNHTGPGQRQGFVIPDFCSLIAGVEKGAEPRIGVGNLSARRDFSDVRDVVRAYRLLMEQGASGEVYNVGSGRAYELKALLETLVKMSTADIEVYTDESKLRPVDLPLIEGDISKLVAATGYAPRYDMDTTLKDTLDYWRQLG